MTVPGDITTVATTYGAILLGTCFGCALTGLVFVQCVLYYKLYPGDYAWTKFLRHEGRALKLIHRRALDLTHTILIVVTAWQSVITGFNKPEDMDLIPPLSLLSVDCSLKDALQLPPAHPSQTLLLIHPPVSSCTPSPLSILPQWIFTVGVTLSASVEIIITTTMIIFLGSRKTGFANMNHIINSLILYTLETGSVTSKPSLVHRWHSIITVASLICWLIMRHNLIFLGMHFAIAKLYANSLLATLNTRKRLRVDRMYSSERDQTGGLAAGLPYSGVNKSHVSQRILGPTTTQKSMQLNVNVETTVVSKIDEGFNDFDHDIEDQRDSLTEFEKDEHKLGELRGSSEKEPNVHFP
ncbi:hypothetical protein M404DRAFT_10295 [Pisolithus tinctorius Marx 270]|uniref:DUF6534 domain-containing protein n=1 Tax=Pisolithus tinctorius Marx 270 TaxID=870435 RepID=A0A0C3NG14_PISTI|nr:hypothetical protein M404DRAFT_10295 [Pisolithus tinctorius Marx 270]